MSLKDLERKLYQKEFERKDNDAFKKTEGSKKESDNEIGSKWSDISADSVAGGAIAKISRLSSWIFWILAPILVILMGVSVFYIYQYFSADKEIALAVSAPQNVLRGVPFEIEANFSNNSKNSLENVELSLFLPEGTAVLEDGKSKRIFSKDIGNLESGEVFQEKIPVIIFGETEAIKRFSISVGYSSSLNARFEKNKDLEIAANEAGVKLDLTAPEKVLNNEEFEIYVDYSNVSEEDFSDVNISFDFPANLVLKESEPALNNNYFKIENLTKGQSGKIFIVGKVIGAEQSFFDIKARIDINNAAENYLISEKTANIYIAPSPLSLKILLNDSVNYISRSGDHLRYRLVYSNNTDVSLADVIIKSKLTGEMFDFTTLKTTGAFDSKNNVLTWNAAAMSALASLSPGANGAVEFEINTKNEYPIKKISSKDFVSKIEAEISSPTVPYYVAADKTIGVSSLDTKVAGRVEIESLVYFNDPDSGFVNKGALPPKINQPINFTIHWKIKNYSTDVKNVKAQAFLEPGVKMIGEPKVNIASLPQYNERTGEIVWQIDKILATKGVVGKPVEAIFQIEVMPNITQIGKEIPLIGQTIITAFDEFVNFELNSSANALDTKNLSDIGFDINNSKVVQ